MAFKRYYPSRDTSIADFDYVSGISVRDISNSNVGAAEILNIYRTSFGGTQDAQSQVMIDFDHVTVYSGSQVFLKLFNAQHSETLPSGYYMSLRSIDSPWNEGVGHDMDAYTDQGFANWMFPTSTSSWLTSSAAITSSIFETGHEDLEINVTDLTQSSFGYQIFIDQAFSDSDLYIKKFHSRQTHFPTKKPYLEVRWNDCFSGTFSTSSFFVMSSGPWSGTFMDVNMSSSALSGAIVSTTNSLVDPTGSLLFSLSQLKPIFDSSEVVNFSLNARPKDWEPAVFLSASSAMTGTVLTNAYYRVVDAVTDEVVVPFGDDPDLPYTKLSYDESGNYFRFDMSNMPTGTLLRFEFRYDVMTGSFSASTFVPGEEFTFRVR